MIRNCGESKTNPTEGSDNKYRVQERASVASLAVLPKKIDGHPVLSRMAGNRKNPV